MNKMVEQSILNAVAVAVGVTTVDFVSCASRLLELNGFV
jgi:hypothetical protein